MLVKQRAVEMTLCFSGFRSYIHVLGPTKKCHGQYLKLWLPQAGKDQ